MNVIIQNSSANFQQKFFNEALRFNFQISVNIQKMRAGHNWPNKNDHSKPDFIDLCVVDAYYHLSLKRLTRLVNSLTIPQLLVTIRILDSRIQYQIFTATIRHLLWRWILQKGRKSNNRGATCALTGAITCLSCFQTDDVTKIAFPTKQAGCGCHIALVYYPVVSRAGFLTLFSPHFS